MAAGSPDAAKAENPTDGIKSGKTHFPQAGNSGMKNSRQGESGFAAGERQRCAAMAAGAG